MPATWRPWPRIQALVQSLGVKLLERSSKVFDLIQNERVDSDLSIIAEPAKKLYVYNIVILLTKNKPVNKIRRKVWALPDESSLPAHSGP